MRLVRRADLVCRAGIHTPRLKIRYMKRVYFSIKFLYIFANPKA